MDVVAALGLPECWIGAEFIKNAVWVHLHQRSIRPIRGDVDVICYDPHRADAPATESLRRGCTRGSHSSNSRSNTKLGHMSAMVTHRTILQLALILCPTPRFRQDKRATYGEWIRSRS
ncbi:nucleotidyltransferase family protein [Novosphingobium soli]|uniref:Nucleotidyltransferase family protein n=1 Tax=Novosphingobium soli TaxID=574956 RepID=A0ABV6D1Y4_9SPHN